MNARLQRRVSMHVRRDAAEQLSNGRVVYDALFSRTGIQTYGDSIEYRPASEVFADASRATGALCPGVLLHPAENFGTKFDGQYDIKGVTGDEIVVHTDGIHTAGKLCVWDDGWNAAIEQGTIAELSVGYTIIPDRTPGVAPDGTRYDVVHRSIIWDHVAGVPAGNAGSARVVTDALASMPFATRAALADMAAARMDAKPLHFIMGRWPHRESPRMDEQPQTPEPAPVAETPKPEPEPAPAAPAAAPVQDAAERQRVFDAAVADAADKRTDLLELARRAIGLDYSSRHDGKPKTDAAIKREIIAKVEPARLVKVDRYTDPRDVAVALDVQLAECREKVDAAANAGPRLLAAIEQTRKDRAAIPEPSPDEIAMRERLDAINTAAGQVRGVPAQATR